MLRVVGGLLARAGAHDWVLSRTMLRKRRGARTCRPSAVVGWAGFGVGENASIRDRSFERRHGASSSRRSALKRWKEPVATACHPSAQYIDVQLRATLKLSMIVH